MVTTPKFITFEGGDGAGKTTLIASIHEALQKLGYEIVRTRAPGGTELGKAIRALLLQSHSEPMDKKAELYLFLADRAQHVEEIIRPSLAKSKVVLCDRYNDSTIAYQSIAREIPKDLVEKLCNLATDSLAPDLTLYLDLDPRIGMQRVTKDKNSKDRIESEDVSFHDKIRSAYLDIAKKEPKRFKVIDASQSKDQVFSEAMRLIHAIF